MRLKATKDLDALRSLAKNAVDRDAEIQRLAFITPGAGQAMVYERKAGEARACVVDDHPTPAKYPLLAASGTDLKATAQQVLNMEQLTATGLALIEERRLAAKRAIDLAASPAAIDSAACVSWET